MNSGKVSSILSSLPIGFISPCISVLALIFWYGTAMAGPGLLFPERMPRIAIDPGHGGADGGAQGPTGHLEKTITLELARQLALTLESDYEVILTRSDDYNIAPRQRSAIANQAKADLFIAIHAGAGFLHGTNGRMVYYHRSLKNEMNNPPKTVGVKDQQHWGRAQMRHKDASIALATTMNQKLGKLDDTTGCKMQSAPLIVLEGADMPAALIEVGHITHPATEKYLRSPQSLGVLARVIAQGVKEYFELSEHSRRP